MKDSLRIEIEQQISEGELQRAGEFLDKYRKEFLYDRDVYFIDCIIELYKGNIDKAYKIADKCVNKFPTSYEAYYYRGCALQAKRMDIEALKNYKIALFLWCSFNNKQVDITNDIVNDICKQIELLEINVENLKQQYKETNNIKGTYKLYSYLQREHTFWGKDEKTLRDTKALIVGKEYWVSDDDIRYVGIYRSPLQSFMDNTDLSAIKTQAEFLKFIGKGTNISIEGDAKEYLLPIASEEQNNVHVFIEGDNKHYIIQRESRHFNYYRVRNKIGIMSKYNSYYGCPIPLIHSKKRKKLVLSFFVDGLSQDIIDGKEFENLMPNTYKFFNKGTVCTQAYSCAEWTYPSLASIESGLNIFNHMMFHNTVDGELPKNSYTLTEYFKREGYYTSKLDGEWRSIHSYGYARGLDQYIYQIQSMGSRAEQEIINIIEHIETFKETDHYLWMTVGDLHDIADGLDLSTAVQKDLTLEEREADDIGETSVKQKYSLKKIAAYKKTIHYFDMLFGLLYTYIENNFSENEILISLFADHGQGYMVHNDRPFLSKERTKVAFMFRGDNVKNQVTDELISTSDYLPIMCKLAGIQYDSESIDGNLPKIFGGQERKYTITDSLHPGDKYYAVANTKEYEIYFESGEKVDDEGRFRLKDYKVYGYYKESGNKIIEDANLLKEYEMIFLKRIAEHIIYE